MENNFRIAVKSFIVKDNNVLLLKRRPNDPHKAGKWDIPGGRLELGEDPFTGIKRETKEETDLDIDIHMPLDIHHFTRDDGQKITMLIFLCNPTTENIKISEEHTDHRWQSLSERENLPEWLHPVLENYESYLKPR
tara:strand:+ start:20993 stop:21400 length:408 start_codon:yes stop_codon:yes gene_type:complete